MRSARERRRDLDWAQLALELLRDEPSPRLFPSVRGEFDDPPLRPRWQDPKELPEILLNRELVHAGGEDQTQDKTTLA